MCNKIKNIVTTFVFVAFIAFFAALCATRFVTPVEYSDVEKRPMAQLPTDFTWNELLKNETVTDENGNVLDTPPIKEFESFAVDQFPFREFFRSIKANFALGVLGLKENNGYAMEDGSIVEVKTEFTGPIIDYQVGRLEYMYEKYLKENGGKHYVTLIPDKNYYFGKDYGYITPDYEALTEQVKQALSDMEYIDLFGSLELEDYYKTDWHWDQSRLLGVLDVLGKSMGFADALPHDYDTNTLSPYYGGYCDQSALYPQPEDITYLTNAVIDACTVYDYETGNTTGVYIPSLFESDTGYDFFLSGMKGLLRIDNPLSTNEGELVVLRDSYGSSLLPLIAQGYRTVWVVDIRYLLPSSLGSRINFSDKDVLFLFSTTVLDSKTFK